MTRRHAPILVLALVAACGTPTSTPAPKWKSLPVAACGMPKYQLIDPATLGAVKHSDEIEELHLDEDAVKVELSNGGYGALLPQVQYGTRVFRFRYTTQDRGTEVDATATIGIPDGPNVPTTPLPMAVFLHGTTGFSDICAPSRSLDGQATAALLASLGFVAVLPDYIGMNGEGDASTAKHAYLVGEQVALGSWDAVRAGRALLKTLDVDAVADSKVVVWGGSQGGQAALYTELYGPYYAPELQVPAVVALVAPTKLAPLALAAVQSWSKPTLSLASAIATMRDWYGAPADLTGVLTDSDPYHFASTIESQVYVQDSCDDTGAGYAAIDDHPEEQTPATVYTSSFIDGVEAGDWTKLMPWSCYLDENSLATSQVKPLRHTPTFMAYSEDDDLVLTAPMRTEFNHLCSLGYQLHFIECAGAGHSQGATWSLPEQLAWVKDRLAGKPLTDMCELHAPVCCEGSPADSCTPN